MIDLTPIVNLLIAVLATLAMRYLVPWIRSNTTAKQREHLMAWVEIAVAAAQQVYYQADGKTRLAYAMNVLASQGFDVNSDAVRDAVEAEVLRLHQCLETTNE